MNDLFRRFARRTSDLLGSSWSFLTAVGIILVWALSGPLFHYSDAWQLVINTGTTIVTFLMVFLIQNTQNRDSRAIQLKLDELIKASTARNSMIDLDSLSDQQIRDLEEEYRRLCSAATENAELVAEVAAEREDTKSAPKNGWSA